MQRAPSSTQKKQPHATATNSVSGISSEDTAAVEAPRRQYLTRNRAVATSDAVLQEKHKLKGPVIASKSLSSSDDTASSSTF
jgi:hypothetical protein